MLYDWEDLVSYFASRGRRRERLTLLNGKDAFDRPCKEHPDGHHTEDLDTGARHVQHEAIHGQGLGRPDCHVPRSLRFQRFHIGGRRCGSNRGRSLVGSLNRCQRERLSGR